MHSSEMKHFLSYIPSLVNHHCDDNHHFIKFSQYVDRDLTRLDKNTLFDAAHAIFETALQATSVVFGGKLVPAGTTLVTAE